MSIPKSIPKLIITIFIPTCCLLVAGCAHLAGSDPAGAQSPASHIADAYGVGNFDRIEAVRFTFHVAKQGKEIQRQWHWEPKTDTVTYRGKSPDGSWIEHTYVRSRMQAGQNDLNAQIDHWFVNDQYWLLFPLHLAWDKGIEILDEGMQPLPIAPGEALRLVVKYPAGVGYTPGDIYELYYGQDYLVKQWIYRKSASPQPTLVATWEKHAKAGPIVFALDHKGADGNFRQWFSDVAVKTVSDSTWQVPTELR
jgi:hypothetical protein